MIFNFGSQAVSIWTWLGPTLVLIGSFSASGVALFGVFRSNKTNQAAIAAADTRAITDRAEQRDRDFRTWQRDTLLRISSEAIEIALNAQDDINRIAFTPLTADAPNIIEQSARKIGAYGLQLRLIGAHEAADRCRDLRSLIASREVLGLLIELNRAHRRSQEPEHAEDDDLKATVLTLRTRFQHEALDAINTVRGAFGETVERELQRLSLPASPP